LGRIAPHSLQRRLLARSLSCAPSLKPLTFPPFARAVPNEKKKEVAAEKVAMQKSVDAAIAGKLDATMKGYLGARFSLKSGQYPHDLKF